MEKREVETPGRAQKKRSIWVSAMEQTCFWVYLKALGVRKLGPWLVVAMTTISVAIVTKETVAKTIITRYKSQVIGSQFCLRTGSSLSPSSITC